jgi:hypothetical protein
MCAFPGEIVMMLWIIISWMQCRRNWLSLIKMNRAYMEPRRDIVGLAIKIVFG